MRIERDFERRRRVRGSCNARRPGAVDRWGSYLLLAGVAIGGLVALVRWIAG